MSRFVQLSLRGVEFVWTIIVMALIGNIMASATDGNTSVINYCMFTVAFSLFTLFYLIPSALSDSYVIHDVLPLTLDTLNAIFFFCAGIALAAKIGAHSCTNHHYLEHNKITRGGNNPEARCRESQAATAFLWFGWACFMASLFFSLAGLGGGSVNLRSGGRKGAPAMSQV